MGKKKPSSRNPLREGVAARGLPPPGVLVIFGGTGDLARRKLVPALYNLAHEGELPSGFSVVGFARRPKSHEAFRSELRQAVDEHSRFRPVNPAVWDAFAQGLFYHQGEFGDATAFGGLREVMEKLDTERGTGGRRLYYLATAPDDFTTVTEQLGEAGLVTRADGGEPAQRVIVEKPFGESAATARALNAALGAVFAERQIYRIDHYLGKETVQNILALRFANEIYEPLWNQKYVDHVQITVSESLGVEGRGGYYDGAGALRDMVQNHLMQLLALVAMEPPASLEAEAIRDEKVKLLRAVRAIPPGQVARCTVRGQYTGGFLAGQEVPGYRQEPRVATDSATETYVALKLYLDNWRWAGVPFYLRHGKRLPKRVAEIAIQFKAPPAVLFAAESRSPLPPNVLVLRIQPDEGVAIRMNVKVPGTRMHLQPVKMDFRYGGSFGARSPEAYERLLHDAIDGDPTLFIRSDETERAWSIMDPVLAGWAEDEAGPAPYEAGTWGPAEADQFIARDGRSWRRP